MKTNDLLFCGLLILGFGMTSCSPDNTPSAPSSSVERIPEAPLLISKTAQISLKEIMSTASQAWSLTDTLQFPQKGSFTRLSVTAQCQWMKHEVSSTKNMTLKKDFSLFELTPWDLLLWNLKSTPAVCHFEFTAFTPSGSSHGFNIKSLKLTAPSHFSVELRTLEKLEPFREASQTLSLNDVQDILLQTPEEPGLQTSLLCPAAKLPSRFPHGVRSLADFNFLSLNEEPVKSTLKNHPLQICRVIMTDSTDVIIKISPALFIQMGSSPLTVENRTVSSANLPALSTHLMQEKFAGIHTPAGFPLITFEVTNHSGTEQFVGLPKTVAHESFGSYDEHRNRHHFLGQLQSGQCVPLKAPALWVDSSLPALKEENGFVIFKIPPQTTFSVNYRLFSEQVFGPRKMGYFPYLIRLSAPIEMTLLQKTPFGLKAYDRQALSLPTEIIKGQGGMNNVKNLLQGCF